MMTVSTHTGWIQTFTGKQFWPLQPRMEDICIEDIAHALSMQCRYGGHCEKFYSVAQHSVLVSYFCDEKDALWGLLHDASEAYLHDICRPLKHSDEFAAYRVIEWELQRLIVLHFGLSEIEPESIKPADNALLRTEQRDLMKPAPVEWEDNRAGALDHVIVAWEPSHAKAEFLRRFEELTSASNGDSTVKESLVISKT